VLPGGGCPKWISFNDCGGVAHVYWGS
jgi:hypothetical protein